MSIFAMLNHNMWQMTAQTENKWQRQLKTVFSIEKINLVRKETLQLLLMAKR